MSTTVSCKVCSKKIVNNAQNITVVSNHNLSGFSSAIKPKGAETFGDLSKFESCDCRTIRLRCKYCHTICGYNVIEPCEYCMSRPNNGHFFIFLNANGSNEEANDSIFEQEFYQFLQEKGVSDASMQIIRGEEIKNLDELKVLSDDILKQAGVKLGDIGRIRSIFTQS